MTRSNDGSSAMSIRWDGGRLFVTGEVDMDTAPALAQALGIVAGDVAVDLSGVRFIDSSGLRVLIDAQLKLEDRRCALSIVDPSPQVARLFDISQLDGYFHVRYSS